MTISRITFVTVGVLLVVSLILGILTAGYTIIRPAKIATGELKGIIVGIEAQDGDLTARVSQKSSDEVGQLVAGVNQFIGVLHGIIAEMKNDAVEMKTVSMRFTDRFQLRMETLWMYRRLWNS